jgi:RNA polymerase sigma-70 factor (ECF subfamily)
MDYIMSDWQSLATYNKIGLHPFGVNARRMSGKSSEIERLNTLDPRAITAIHDRYFPEVYRFARFRVNDESTAEDIAGDVFMHLLEAVHHGNGPHTNLRGWLLRTTANIVNDHFRKIYNLPREEPAEILENSPDLFLSQADPVLISAQAERRRLLHAAIDELTDAQKLVITLRFGNRFSLEMTAQLMGKNTNTIKALQFRALAALRQKLGNDIL